MPFRSRLSMLLVALLLVLPLLAQETDGFFSGTISEVGDDKVTVIRTILGKAPETRSFLVKTDTKVEGKMKPKLRVTVRYVPSEEGDVALSIIVRADTKTESKKRP